MLNSSQKSMKFSLKKSTIKCFLSRKLNFPKFPTYLQPESVNQILWQKLSSMGGGGEITFKNGRQKNNRILCCYFYATMLPGENLELNWTTEFISNLFIGLDSSKPDQYHSSRMIFREERRGRGGGYFHFEIPNHCKGKVYINLFHLLTSSPFFFSKSLRGVFANKKISILWNVKKGLIQV